MADYYCYLTIDPKIPQKDLTAEEIEILGQHNIDIDIVGGDRCFLYSEDYNPEAYLTEDTSHTEEQLFELFQDIIQRSDELKFLSLEIAYTSSKMEAGAFGGAAVFITEDEIKYMSTWSWLEEQIKNVGGDE
jgi:hypothetical protein